MKFLVLDDDIYFAEAIASIIKEKFSRVKIDIYTDITNNIDVLSYEAYFLDIEVGDKSGFKFSEKINHLTYGYRPIIFVTSHIELWNESYHYHPFWFINKSNYQEDFNRMLDDLSKTLEFNCAYIEVICNQIKITIKLRDILYLYKEGNYTFIQTDNTKYKTYISLKNILKQIAQKDLFIRVNSGCLVNKNYIKDYCPEKKEVISINEKRFTVSRSCSRNIINLINNRR